MFLVMYSGAFAQVQIPSSVPTSVDSKLVLDAAGDKQRKAITSIWLITCPGVGAGTGFAVKEGFLVTNSHVVSTCSEGNLLGIGAKNEVLHFSKIIRDDDVDLALLIPTQKVQGGFVLANDSDPLPGI